MKVLAPVVAVLLVAVAAVIYVIWRLIAQSSSSTASSTTQSIRPQVAQRKSQPPRTQPGSGGATGLRGAKVGGSRARGSE